MIKKEKETLLLKERTELLELQRVVWSKERSEKIDALWQEYLDLQNIKE